MIKIGEGKSKIIYSNNEYVYLEFKGDVRCSNQKEQYDARIAELRAETNYNLYNYLAKHMNGILVPEMVNNKTLKMKKADPYPLEWIPRFVAAGSVVKRFGFKEGYVFNNPILKIDYKTEIDDYLITDELIIEKKIMSSEELIEAKQICRKIALILKEFFLSKGLVLWDFKLELGKLQSGSICLIDEISLDGMRLKDISTGESFDKDVYRKTGDKLLLIKAYEEGYNRLFA